jgi:hypothetical protein
MPQRNKRFKGIYRSGPWPVPSGEIEGTIYNAFPYLETEELKKGERAFYFPTIRGVYTPPDANASDFDSRHFHEHTPSRV